MDRYFDLHPPVCWTRGGRKDGKFGMYVKWLNSNTTPIYMQKKYPEVPASIEYPRGRILLEFSIPRRYFANHVAWMIALALSEGVGTIGLFGINYSHHTEYGSQRGCAEFWLGFAGGRGVRIVLPEQCDLLREPALLYGYESHDEKGKLREEYRKLWPGAEIKPLVPGQKPPSIKISDELRLEIEREEAEYPRPKWALGPLPDKPNGGTEANG